MNKMIWIALGVLLFVGISYQAKRTHDQRRGGTNATNRAKNPEGSAVVANGTTPGAAGTASTTPTGVTAQGTSTTADGKVGMNGTNVTAGAVPATGTGKSSVTASATSADGKVAIKAEPEKPKDNCFAFEYRHKKEARDQDIENFLDFTNAFPIARADYNPKSLCVKVNQKAVNFQMAKGKTGTEVRVGSMVGPESVIRVSYCVGKISPCHETCVPPKKRFMDDLMNDAGEEDTFTDSWGKDGDDKAGEKNKKELKEKSKELRAIASENDHLNEGSVQRDWEELQKQEWVCK